MRISRISAIFILAVLISLSCLAGCLQNEELNPDDIWNSPKFKKNLTPQPGIGDEVLRIDLILYKSNPDAKMQDLGYMQTLRLVIPFKKWDDRIYIDGADSSVNVHLDNSFKFARKEANGEIVVYEAVHQLIWQISDLKGDPIGFINDYGMIFKWESKTGLLKNYGTGSFRKAIMLFFDLKWNIYIQENPYDKEWDFGYSRLYEKSSSDINIIGNDESEKPYVVLKKMDVYQLEQRYEKNLKPLLVRSKDIRGIPVSEAERAGAKSSNGSEADGVDDTNDDDDDADDEWDDDDDDEEDDW